MRIHFRSFMTVSNQQLAKLYSEKKNRQGVAVFEDAAGGEPLALVPLHMVRARSAPTFDERVGEETVADWMRQAQSPSESVLDATRDRGDDDLIPA